MWSIPPTIKRWVSDRYNMKINTNQCKNYQNVNTDMTIPDGLKWVKCTIPKKPSIKGQCDYFTVVPTNELNVKIDDHIDTFEIGEYTVLVICSVDEIPELELTSVNDINDKMTKSYNIFGDTVIQVLHIVDSKYLFCNICTPTELSVYVSMELDKMYKYDPLRNIVGEDLFKSNVKDLLKNIDYITEK